jgi:hypothetical protein
VAPFVDRHSTNLFFISLVSSLSLALEGSEVMLCCCSRKDSFTPSKNTKKLIIENDASQVASSLNFAAQLPPLLYLDLETTAVSRQLCDFAGNPFSRSWALLLYSKNSKLSFPLPSHSFSLYMDHVLISSFFYSCMYV